MPAGDTATDRPVVIILHTGSFLPAIANGQATGIKLITQLWNSVNVLHKKVM